MDKVSGRLIVFLRNLDRCFERKAIGEAICMVLERNRITRYGCSENYYRLKFSPTVATDVRKKLVAIKQVAKCRRYKSGCAEHKILWWL